MPHLPAKKSSTAAETLRQETSPEDLETLRANKGADLLLSLAVTASQHAREDTLRRDPVSPSPTGDAEEPSLAVRKYLISRAAATKSSCAATTEQPLKSHGFCTAETSPSNEATTKRVISNASLEENKTKRARTEDSRQTERVVSPTLSNEEETHQQQHHQRRPTATTPGQPTVPPPYYSPHMMPGYHHPSYQHAYGSPPPYGYPYPPQHSYHPLMHAASPTRPYPHLPPPPPGYPPVEQTKPAAKQSPDRNVQSSPGSAEEEDVVEAPAVEQQQQRRHKQVEEEPIAAAAGVVRCTPLKRPLPSRCWDQDVEAAENIKLPEFSSLVNFPEFATRGARSISNNNPVLNCGKKACVMCGKMRVCSASSVGRRGHNSGSDADTLHIIPRQNKGVCTVCDVTVWVIEPCASTDQQVLEIKWCKGCKNFRPWAAFGVKGMATKCVRCRTRQKEKYAATKVGAAAKNQKA